MRACQARARPAGLRREGRARLAQATGREGRARVTQATGRLPGSATQVRTRVEDDPHMDRAVGWHHDLAVTHICPASRLHRLNEHRPGPDDARKLERAVGPYPVADVAATAQKAVAAIGCIGCHLDHFQGDGTVPRLAGMGRDYLTKTINDFRSRARGNNPGMTDLMLATAPDDLAALEEYLAGL